MYNRRDISKTDVIQQKCTCVRCTRTSLDKQPNSIKEVLKRLKTVYGSRLSKPKVLPRVEVLYPSQSFAPLLKFCPESALGHILSIGPNRHTRANGHIGPYVIAVKIS